TSLKNQGAVMHTVGMVLNAGWIENEDEFRFYYDGFSPSVCAIAEKIDRERIAILDSLGLDSATLEELFYLGGFLPARTTFYNAIAKSEANKFIPAPKALHHRYIDEDVLYGLVPMRSLASSIGVASPVMDSLITMATLLLNRNFSKEGITLEKLGLAELTKDQLLTYVETGILP
ncbi:MAG: NAD/NADP octopine/nopaline dehydrogenase family protein, partial [Candidatus Ranarchaeia archaeon]